MNKTRKQIRKMIYDATYASTPEARDRAEEKLIDYALRLQAGIQEQRKLLDKLEAREEPSEEIFDLFQKVREHPDFIGGTYFTKRDVPEGQTLGTGFKAKWLTEPLVKLGFSIIYQEAFDEE